MGTEIFKFGPEQAEKFTFKDCNFYSEIINWWSKFSCWLSVPQMIDFVLEGQGTFIFEENPKLGVFQNCLVISFLMCTGTLKISQKWWRKLGLKMSTNLWKILLDWIILEDPNPLLDLLYKMFIAVKCEYKNQLFTF